MLGGQLGGGLGDPVRPDRRPSGPARGRGRRQRVGIAGQFGARHAAREPCDLVGVPALVRPYARLRRLEHGHGPARAQRRGRDRGGRDRLADLGARARDHQYRHVSPPAPRRTPRGRSVPRPRRR